MNPVLHVQFLHKAKSTHFLHGEMRGPWEAAAICQAINVQHSKRQFKYQTDQIIIIKISTQENKAHLKELEGTALTLLAPREVTNC